MALGSFLTWASVDAGFAELSKSGMDGDGLLTLPGALVLGGLAAAALLTAWSKGRMIGAGDGTDGTDCPPPPCSLY